MTSEETKQAEPTQPLSTPPAGSKGSTVLLTSMENEILEVPSNVICLSTLIKNMLDGDNTLEVALPGIKSSVLAKVIQFCTHHQSEPMQEIPKPVKFGRTVHQHVQRWYGDFVDSLQGDLLFETILAANYLDVRPLMDLTCCYVGLKMQNKTPQQVREVFNIPVEFPSEVERAIREENKWSTEPPVAS